MSAISARKTAKKIFRTFKGLGKLDEEIWQFSAVSPWTVRLYITHQLMAVAVNECVCIRHKYIAGDSKIADGYNYYNRSTALCPGLPR